MIFWRFIIEINQQLNANYWQMNVRCQLDIIHKYRNILLCLKIAATHCFTTRTRGNVRKAVLIACFVSMTLRRRCFHDVWALFQFVFTTSQYKYWNTLIHGKWTGCDGHTVEAIRQAVSFTWGVNRSAVVTSEGTVTYDIMVAWLHTRVQLSKQKYPHSLCTMSDMFVTKITKMLSNMLWGYI